MFWHQLCFISRAQHYEVALPKDLKCIDCSIRLVREASEWGGKYQFWSCADVDILPQKETFLEICSGRGRAYVGGRCRCDPGAYGEFCQYQDDCVQDKDCGIHGRCQDIMSTSAPRKQCYCQAGYFGEGCKQENPKILFNKNFQEGLYTKKELSDKVTIYWRLLKEIQEIEVVMKSQSTSWVALGWRPKSLTGSCKKFPVLADQEPAARSLDLSKYPEDSKSEPEPESEPEGKYDDIDAEAEAEAEAEPEPSKQVQAREARGGQVSAKRKRMTTRTDVGISFVTSSVSGNRKKRAAINRSLYTPRYPRAFAIPLRDGEETTTDATTSTTTEKEQTGKMSLTLTWILNRYQTLYYCSIHSSVDSFLAKDSWEYLVRPSQANDPCVHCYPWPAAHQLWALATPWFLSALSTLLVAFLSIWLMLTPAPHLKSPLTWWSRDTWSWPGAMLTPRGSHRHWSPSDTRWLAPGSGGHQSFGSFLQVIKLIYIFWVETHFHRSTVHGHDTANCQFWHKRWSLRAEWRQNLTRQHKIDMCEGLI